MTPADVVWSGLMLDQDGGEVLKLEVVLTGEHVCCPEETSDQSDPPPPPPLPSVGCQLV